ncbi:MAG: GTPase HflX [Phycisphaerales bacterium]|nr:GTPase HflX [Phycisphaerales bacterium]
MSQIQREQLKVARERAVLVSVRLPRDEVDLETRLGELAALARTADAEVVGVLTQARRLPSGKTFIGKGKLEELAAFVESERATLVLFDHELSPGQIRNLERETSCKIIDRSELILDIFARRATTHAAKLQVEIAQLQYTYPRLRAMWDHLGQVTGGAPIGIGTRGPGEKQLEIDRRLVKRRLGQLRSELESIQQRKVREVHARNEDHFTVGLVGYTNVGKSTIFNQLTDGGAFANDRLFATLSTRVERWDLGGGNQVMLSDTVGFIRKLPHHLVASFRSTLEETVHCQLLLNKIDQLEHRDLLLPWLRDYPQAIPVSAVTGEGLDVLSETVRAMFVGPIATVRLTVELSEGSAIDFIEKRTLVEDREYGDGVVIYTTSIGRRQLDQLLARSTRILIDDRDATEVAREARGGGWGSRRSSPMPPHRLQAPDA